jgi:hypothetical protein
MEIIVLQKDELEQLMRRVADMAVDQLRDELGRSQTPELMTRDQLKDYLNCHRSTIPRYIATACPSSSSANISDFENLTSIFG